MSENKNMDRSEFMTFFRDDEMLNTLSNNDRLEVFSLILSGGSDINKEILDSLINDYGCSNLIIVDLSLIIIDQEKRQSLHCI